MNRRNHSFVMESKLHDVKGRVDYISSPKRQENLYAVFSNVEDSYWELLVEQNQRDFAKSGTEGTCIEARELIIMLPPSLIEYDHELLLKYMTCNYYPYCSSGPKTCPQGKKEKYVIISQKWGIKSDIIL